MRRLLALPLIGLFAMFAACGDDSGAGGEGGEGGGSTKPSTSSASSSKSSAASTSSSSSSSSQASTATSSSSSTASSTSSSSSQSSTSSGMGAELDCNDGIDDDSDTDVDCDDSDCAQAAVCGDLVINEVDYDNVGAEDFEFVEIFNAGANPVDLSTVDLLIVNGNNGTVAHTEPLVGTLPAGGYLVVADMGVTVDAGAQVIVPATTFNVENGAPDGVVLYDTVEQSLIDVLTYEGEINAAMIDGMTLDISASAGGTPLDDDNGTDATRSLIRFPNGVDNNDAPAEWQATLTITPGAANVATEICDNLTDDDGDSDVDCLDADCTGHPACSEICDNGIDDDGDTLADCDDGDCAAQACDQMGGVCMGNMCVCAGGSTETDCDDGVDNDCGGGVDCADTDCASDPVCLTTGVNSVDFPVIAHGGQLVITGAGFTGATAVTIGGIAQTGFVVNSDSQITIPAVPDLTPIGAAVPLVITTPGGDTTPFNLAVIHLVINELDSDTPGMDAGEFVEISTGVPGVNLTGYSLVFWNGSNDQSYYATNLDVITDANGLVLVGNAGVVPAPAITFGGNVLQNGQDGAAIYQAAPFTNNTPVTAAGLIDALVYDTADADDDGLLDVLFGVMGTLGRVQVDEGTGGAAGPAEMQSVQRCDPARRRGDKFTAATPPSPGAPNTVAACP